MANGDTLQILDGHQAFAAPASGVQTVTLLGPFSLDTASGQWSSGANVIQDVVELPDGVCVLATFPIVRSFANQDGADDLRCQIIMGTYVLSRWTLVNDEWSTEDPYAVVPDPIIGYLGDIPRMAIAQHSAILRAALYFTGSGAPSGGEIDIYVFIAAPAA